MASATTRLMRGVSIWSILVGCFLMFYVIYLRHSVTELTYLQRRTHQKVQALRLHSDLLLREKQELAEALAKYDNGNSNIVVRQEADSPIGRDRIVQQQSTIERLENQLSKLERKYHDLEQNAQDAQDLATKLERRHREDLNRISNNVGSNLPSPHQGPFLFIMVMTIPKALEERNAMRNTWLKYRGKDAVGSVIHRFMIGISTLTDDAVTLLEEENTVHGDLALIPHFKEEFFNLTGKLLESMSWGIENLGMPQYVFKVDDDTFVRLDLLLNELHDVPSDQANRLYYGYFDGRAEVRRNGKYREMDWTVCNTYLPYALGGGYVVSGEIAHLIVQNKPKMQLYSRFHAEDVSMGLWTAPLNISRRHDTRFDTEWMSRGCSNQYIVMHRSSAKDMEEKHTLLHKTDFTEHCSVEFRVKRRSEYEYNWTALPLDCCEGRGKH